MEEKSEKLGIGPRLRKLLLHRGETLKAFAERSGIPYRTLQNHVAGTIKPNAEQLTKFAEAGIDVNFLLTGTPVLMLPFSQPVVLLDEKTYFTYSDKDIISYVHGLTEKVVNLAIKKNIEDGRVVEIKAVIGTFRIVLQAILTIIGTVDIPLVEMRRASVPLNRVLDAVLGTSVDALTQLALNGLAHVDDVDPASDEALRE